MVKRCVYVCLMAMLITSLAHGAVVDKMFRGDLWIGDPSTPYTSPKGRTGYRISNFAVIPPVIDVRDLGALTDNTGKVATSAAFLAASDACPSTGCTVLIPAGNYLVGDSRLVYGPGDVTGTEWVVFPVKSNMHVVMAEGATIYMENDWTANRACFTNIFGMHEVDNVVIEGGTIVGDTGGSAAIGCEWGYGVYIGSSTNVTVKNVRIKNIAGDGIIVTAGYTGYTPGDPVSSNIKLIGNKVSSAMRNGITVGGATDVEIAGNDISAIGEISDYSGRPGIDVEAEMGIVKKVNIHGNRIHDTGIGIILYPATYAVYDVGVEGNYLWNFSAVNGSGVLMNGGTENVRVLGNHFDNCSADAVTGTSSNKVVVGGNLIRGTTGSGIAPYLSWGWNIYGNSISDSSVDGMVVTGDNTATQIDPILVHGNTIERSGRHGVQVVSGSAVEINGNVIDNNTSSGIHHAKANFASIAIINNRISRNLGLGVDISGDNAASTFDNVSVIGNTIYGNGSYGVRLYYNNGGLVSGNKVFGNTLQGIYFSGGTHNSAIGNHVNNNSSSGINLNGVDNSAVLNNTVVGNTDYGILIQSSDNNSILGNFVRSGGVTSIGIEISSVASDGTFINGNDAYGGGTTKGIEDQGTGTSFGAGNRKNDGSFAASGE